MAGYWVEVHGAPDPDGTETPPWLSSRMESDLAPTGLPRWVKEDIKRKMGPVADILVHTVRVWGASSATTTRPSARPLVVQRADTL
ncbi:hypothetical protein [Streptomyces sp. NPDC054883]